MSVRRPLRIRLLIQGSYPEFYEELVLAPDGKAMRHAGHSLLPYAPGATADLSAAHLPRRAFEHLADGLEESGVYALAPPAPLILVTDQATWSFEVDFEGGSRWTYECYGAGQAMDTVHHHQSASGSYLTAEDLAALNAIADAVTAIQEVVNGLDWDHANPLTDTAVADPQATRADQPLPR